MKIRKVIRASSMGFRYSNCLKRKSYSLCDKHTRDQLIQGQLKKTALGVMSTNNRSRPVIGSLGG